MLLTRKAGVVFSALLSRDLSSITAYSVDSVIQTNPSSTKQESAGVRQANTTKKMLTSKDILLKRP